MPGGPPLASRIAGISAAMAGLLNQLAERESQRHEPGMADLVLGNPQEMPLPGFVAALRQHADPARPRTGSPTRFSEPETRAVVAAALRQWRGLPFEPEDIALTPGAFGALAAAFRALLDPGDEVIYLAAALVPLRADAAVPPMRSRSRSASSRTTTTSTSTAIEAAIGPRTRAVIVNTPHNPTGRIYPPRDAGRAGGPARPPPRSGSGRPIWLISDEPYAGWCSATPSSTAPASSTRTR